jgi:outer membrane protein assembly factor BamB
MHTKTFSLCAALMLVICASHAADTQWTRFRGPNGTGLAGDAQLPTKWTEADFAWRVKLPGNGHGSPTVWGDRIYTMTGDLKANEVHALCYDLATGKQVWQKTFKTSAHRLHKYNHYSTATPAIDDKHVYIYWTMPENVTIMALTHAGDTVWTRELGSYTTQHGGGGSPVVYDGIVYISHDQFDVDTKKSGSESKSMFYALDAATGETKWSHKRPGGKTPYCAPMVIDVDGSKQLIVSSTAYGMAAFEPKSGKEIWRLPNLYKLRVVASPGWGAGLLFTCDGSGGGGKFFGAVKPGNGKDPAKKVWEARKSIPYVPSPIVVAGNLYLTSDGGIITCMDPATGKVKFQQRVDEEKGVSFYGSPVAAGDKLYCTTRNGEMVVIEAGDTYKLLGRNPLGEATDATPAVAGNKLIIRTYSHLLAIGK